MKSNDKGIRTIHDAIDVKAKRILNELSEKASKDRESITNRVYSNLGLTAALDKIEELTGDRPHVYQRNDSKLSKALEVAMKPMEIYTNKSKAIALVVENAHIAIVTDDKADVLAQLDKDLRNIK